MKKPLHIRGQVRHIRVTARPDRDLIHSPDTRLPLARFARFAIEQQACPRRSGFGNHRQRMKRAVGIPVAERSVAAGFGKLMTTPLPEAARSAARSLPG